MSWLPFPPSHHLWFPVHGSRGSCSRGLRPSSSSIPETLVGHSGRIRRITSLYAPRARARVRIIDPPHMCWFLGYMVGRLYRHHGFLCPVCACIGACSMCLPVASPHHCPRACSHSLCSCSTLSVPCLMFPVTVHHSFPRSMCLPVVSLYPHLSHSLCSCSTLSVPCYCASPFFLLVTPTFPLYPRCTLFITFGFPFSMFPHSLLLCLFS
jgi:hypothetical protein